MFFQEFSHLTTNFGNFAADLVKGVCGLIFPLFRELRRNFFFCIIPLTFPLFFANVFSSSSSAVFQYFESLIFLLIVQVKRASLFVELVHLLLMHLILLFVSNVPISSATSLISSLMPAISALTSSNSAEARLAFVANSSRILSKFSRSFSALSCVFSSNESTVGPSDSPFLMHSLNLRLDLLYLLFQYFVYQLFQQLFRFVFHLFSCHIF